jgi:hypothetical protein
LEKTKRLGWVPALNFILFWKRPFLHLPAFFLLCFKPHTKIYIRKNYSSCEHIFLFPEDFTSPLLSSYWNDGNFSVLLMHWMNHDESFGKLFSQIRMTNILFWIGNVILLYDEPQFSVWMDECFFFIENCVHNQIVKLSFKIDERKRELSWSNFGDFRIFNDRLL